MAFSGEASECRPEICSLVRGIKNAGSPWNHMVAAYLLDVPTRFNEILNMGEGDKLRRLHEADRELDQRARAR